jgi:hypothetical protein
VQGNVRTAKITVSADGRGLVCQAGAVLLSETLRVSGLAAGLPAVPRLVTDLPRALKAIRGARAAARERPGPWPTKDAPGADGGLVTVDLDATIVTAGWTKSRPRRLGRKPSGFIP